MIRNDNWTSFWKKSPPTLRNAGRPAGANDEETLCFPIDLSGQKGIVFGVANDRSIAWAITESLSQAGARLALTYQGERLKQRVESLSGDIGQPLAPAVRRHKR